MVRSQIAHSRIAAPKSKKKSIIRKANNKSVGMPKKEPWLIKAPTSRAASTFVFPPKNDKCRGQRNPTEFERMVYIAASRIPPGKVSTYGNLAKFLGTASRAVGNALRKNPYSPIVPCHRIVASTMELGGFHGASGASTPEVTTMLVLLNCARARVLMYPLCRFVVCFGRFGVKSACSKKKE